MLGKDLGNNEEESRFEQAIEAAKADGMKKSEDGASLPEGEEMVLQAYIRYYKGGYVQVL